MPVLKRPASVVVSGILFWGMSLATFAMHIQLARRGMVDALSFLFAGMLLLAAILWLASPRSLLTYYAGSVSLVLCVIRILFTARAIYQFRATLNDPGALEIMMRAIALLIGWLAMRFMFGAPSRAYFGLKG